MAIGKAEIEKRFGHHAAAIEGAPLPSIEDLRQIMREFNSEEKIRDLFRQHRAPNPNEDTHAKIRRVFVDLAIALDVLIPDSRTKTVALTELESASMWAHKAVAGIPQGKFGGYVP